MRSEFYIMAVEDGLDTLREALASRPPQRAEMADGGAVLVAVELGDIGALAALLDAGFTACIEGDGGAAVVDALSSHRDADRQAMLDLLVDHESLRGAQLSNRFVDNWAWRPDIALAIVRSGVDPMSRGRYGTTPLHHARTVELARALLDAGADPNDDVAAMGRPRDRGLTPLHLMCAREPDGQPDDVEGVVGLLLDRGAEPDPVSELGKTPLQQACLTGKVDVAMRLAASGADPRRHAGDPHSPLRLAVGGIRPSLTLLQALVDAGGDPNETDESGSTLLHAAARAGRPDIVRWLMGRGLDPGRADGNGCVAADLTAHPEVLAALGS